ncbi:hypothetical protein ACTXT7_010564 [Hymenolepis weldensis]
MGREDVSSDWPTSAHPRQSPKAVCQVEIKDSERRSEEVQSSSSRLVISGPNTPEGLDDRYNVLHEELVRRSFKGFDEIYTVFTTQKINICNATLGLQWREVAKQQINAINLLNILEERSRSYLENLWGKKYDFYLSKDANLQWGLLNMNRQRLMRNLVVMPSTKRAALMSRLKQFALNKQIGPELIKGPIHKCPA